MLEINKIHQGNSAELLKQIEDNLVDLTVTSPPYDNLRDYKGYSFDFKTIAKELYRVTKEGGVIVWVVGDATINGSETGTSFRQALFFMKCGFNLHDTMIYAKQNPVPYNHNRYNPQFEYMFVLSKGKPNTFNPLREDKKTKGKCGNFRYPDGSLKPANTLNKDKTKLKNNIWFYIVGTASGKKEFKHPASFPKELAKDHIISWSNKGDIILDPFVGSGTTCKIAKLQGRKFIGIDISEEYCQIARKRIRQETLFPLDTKHEGGNGIPPTNF